MDCSPAIPQERELSLEQTICRKPQFRHRAGISKIPVWADKFQRRCVHSAAIYSLDSICLFSSETVWSISREDNHEYDGDGEDPQNGAFDLCTTLQLLCALQHCVEPEPFVDGRVAGHLGAADGLKTLSIHVCVCPHFGM